jgi:GST-like protein
MIDLYGMSSPNVHKVSIMLEELDLPYNFRYVNVAGGAQFEADFTALNPLSRVPVMVDSQGPEGRPYTVFESGAILYYLARKTGRFLPDAGEGHFEVMKWLMVQMGNVGPLLGQHTHFTRFAPPGNEYSQSRYRTLAWRIYDVLEARLTVVPYLSGEEYSIADMATYPWVSLYHDLHGMSWDEHPSLRAWCDRLAARPAVATADAKYADRMKDDPTHRPDLPQDGIDRFFGWGAYARK